MKVYLRSSLLLVLAATIISPASAQFKLPKIKIPTSGLSDKILKEDPPITTSLDDAVLGVPYLDDFDPKTYKPMTELERDSEGSFILESGDFQFEAQSYCMHAGTYGPGKGNGYLLAPLKGKQAEAITAILKSSLQHPEIGQDKIQILIWAIISRTKVSDMDRDMQSTAAKLLKPAQKKKFDPSKSSAVPASRGSQRLAVSAKQYGQ